jgi:DNA-binding MarR family transcriptional regulator
MQENVTPCGQEMSVGEAHTLMFLLSDSSPSQQELADVLGVDKSTAHRLVKKLSNQGLLLVEPSEHDARAKCLRLTEQGRKRANTVDRASQGLFLQIQEQIPEDLQIDVLNSVRILAEAIKKTTKGSNR